MIERSQEPWGFTGMPFGRDLAPTTAVTAPTARPPLTCASVAERK